MTYKKLITSGLAFLIMTSLATTSANAKCDHHIRQIHSTRVDSTKRSHKSFSNYHHKNKSIKKIKSKQLYRMGKRASYDLPFTAKQIKRAKRLMNNRYFINGLRSGLRNMVGYYSKRSINTHMVHLIANYRSYLYGNYHYRIGFLASNAESNDKEYYAVHHTKHSYSFWKGFYAGVYVGFGWKAHYQTARMEFKELGHLKDDVAPPYDS